MNIVCYFSNKLSEIYYSIRQEVCIYTNQQILYLFLRILQRIERFDILGKETRRNGGNHDIQKKNTN